MHKSQLAGLIIDCQTDDLDQAAAFWSRALGYAIQHPANGQEDTYRTFDVSDTRLHVEVQKVAHPSRVHLDIATDDVEAEVYRLERLGAKRLTQVHTWWVMEAPTGHRFCVIPAESANLSSDANQWDE